MVGQPDAGAARRPVSGTRTTPSPSSRRRARWSRAARSPAAGRDRTTVRPIVSRRSSASSSAGTSAKSICRPITGRIVPARARCKMRFQMSTPCAGGQEVHAERPSRPRRVDEGEADPDEVEVPVDARLDRQRALLLLDAGGEPDDEVTAVEGHGPERVRRHRSADGVERHVDSPPVGDVVDEGDEVARCGSSRRSRRRATGRRRPSRRCPAVPITVAPNALASWTAAEPTPPAAGVDEHDVARGAPVPGRAGRGSSAGRGSTSRSPRRR